MNSRKNSFVIKRASETTAMSSGHSSSSDTDKSSHAHKTSTESTSGDESSFHPNAQISHHNFVRLGIDLPAIPTARTRFLCCVCCETLANDREKSLGNSLRWRSFLLFTRRVLSSACGVFCVFCHQAVCALCIETKKKVPACKTLTAPKSKFHHDWILHRAVLPKTVCCECRTELPTDGADAFRCLWCMRGVCLGCQDSLADPAASASALCDLGRLRGALLLPGQVELLPGLTTEASTPSHGNGSDIKYKVHNISRRASGKTGKLTAVIDSMNIVVIVTDDAGRAWQQLGRLLLHPLQVLEWREPERPTAEGIAKLLEPFCDVLKQVTVAVAGTRALTTETLRAIRKNSGEATAVVEMGPLTPADVEEGVAKAREDLMDVARTKYSGANLGVLKSVEIWRLRISSVDGGGILIAADEVYVSGWVNLGDTLKLVMNEGELGQLLVRSGEDEDMKTGSFTKELEGTATLNKLDIDGIEYDLMRRVGISDNFNAPEEARSRLFQHRLRLAMGGGAAASPAMLQGWKFVLSFDFDQKLDGVALRRPVESSGYSEPVATVTSVISEFLHDTILAPIMEGPSSSRSSLM
jgi:hypothetical protein